MSQMRTSLIGARVKITRGLSDDEIEDKQHEWEAMHDSNDALAKREEMQDEIRSADSKRYLGAAGTVVAVYLNAASELVASISIDSGTCIWDGRQFATGTIATVHVLNLRIIMSYKDIASKFNDLASVIDR